MSEIFLDTLGEMCPLPILRAEKELKKMKAGDVLVLETDHSCSVTVIPRHFKKVNYPSTVTKVDVGVWQIRIQKTANRSCVLSENG
jgi:TusA-related sulfurtransferase